MTETSIEDPRPAISSSSERPSPYAWYVALVLMLSYILSFIDRKLPFILAEPIKRDLHLSDTQIGLITGLSFTLVYSVAAFPIAMMADRYSRKYIIATSIFIWSVVTTLGGFAGNFLQLTAARSGVAIGEAGSSPAAFSILRDYFPPRYRGRAVGLYMVGAQVGILLGLPLAGWLNDLSNWRVAMMLVGAPGILLTLLVVLTVREPKRQVTSAQSAVKVQGLWATLRALARIPTYRHLFWAGILFNCTGGGFLSFSPAYVMRTFHLTTTQTGLSYGIVTGAAGALGAASGGIVGDFLKKFDDRWPLWFVGVGMIVGTPCLIWAFLSHDYLLFLAFLFIPHFTLMTYAGPSFSAIQSVVNPRSTALASAVFLFALNGIGLSAGSYLAGAISDSLHSLGPSVSLRWAIILLSSLNLWAALHYFLAGRALPKDIEARAKDG